MEVRELETLQNSIFLPKFAINLVSENTIQ